MKLPMFIFAAFGASLLAAAHIVAFAQTVKSVSAPVHVEATVVSSCKVKVPRSAKTSNFANFPVGDDLREGQRHAEREAPECVTPHRSSRGGRDHQFLDRVSTGSASQLTSHRIPNGSRTTP